MTEAIQKIIDEQGWNDESVLELLWSYVEAQGADEAVLDHFIRAQLEEDSAADADEEPQLVFFFEGKQGG
jgi:hypothetical protein